MSFRNYWSSRSSYTYLRDSCLALLYISYLRRLSSLFYQSGTINDDGDDLHLVYLKQKCIILSEVERISTQKKNVLSLRLGDSSKNP